VMERVEAIYSNWYLGQLGANWSNVVADDLRDYGHVKDIDRQTDFYNRKIKNAGSKMFVIISDALRYEVAASLSEQLQRENQCQVKLSSMQAVFPTITKFGMAALLPHKELTTEIKGTSKTERLAVLADGQSTESNNRENVLKKADPESVVLKYKDILPMSRSERRSLVEGKNVVYIYHDKVDHASHTDETTVFAACDEAINDIKNIIRIITNEFGGANIIVTADHGFLYTYTPLSEDSKVDKTSDSDMDVEYGRRYAITKPGATMDYLLPVKFLGKQTVLESWAPRENIRIKMTGAGLNYVHGGISLQEMVVPVVEYHNLRNDSSEYKKNKSKYDTKPVTVNLLSANRKISNMIFSLNFYQVEPVSENREAATYKLYFTDEYGTQISDVQKIIADKTTDNNQERTFRCTFNLKSLQYKNTNIYYLVIADEDGLQVGREDFQIDIAFAVDDFNFF
ncbi:MAG: BREX-1 system phosphatase PglZ type A, partial [Parasporobacterium sp.]|nr:BREX-1 system phosphatase PglZ type A [Parasporobacterium sp.]